MQESIPEADLYEMTKGWFMLNYEKRLVYYFLLLFSPHHLLCRVETIYALPEEESYLTLDRGYREECECQKRYRYPLEDIVHIVTSTKVCIATHDMYRENAREYDSREEHCEDERARDRHCECCERVIDRIKYPRHISDEKKHEWPACPKKMIVDEVGGFSDFFYARNFLIFYEFGYHIFDIGTSP